MEEHGDYYSIVAFKHLDIYPLVGGKHKKIIAYVQCIDRNGEIQEKEFKSDPGYDKEISLIMPKINGWISLVSGKSTSVPLNMQPIS